MQMAAGFLPLVSGRQNWALFSLIMAFSLAGCADKPEKEVRVPTPPSVEKPVEPEFEGPTQAELREARAERNREANLKAASVATDAVSQSRRSFYNEIEQKLLDSGRLRNDRGTAIASPDVDSLTRNFIQIALKNEYDSSGNSYAEGAEPQAPLRKWEQPVAIRTAFGASSDSAARRAIQGEVSAYAARLAEASGHSVATTEGKGNFTLLVLAESERRDIGRYIRELAPTLPAKDISTLSQLSPNIYCTVFAYSQGQSYSYAHAVALIRAELPPRLRQSCIHEELAQGMGLANDDPTVRPSVFNDDEEFALLTYHDELLLRILYDPRLRPGMTEEEATPIVRKIAGELLAD